MNRIRLTTGPAALFGAAFVVALIVLMPMRLALGWLGLGDSGFAARSVSGSIWWGSLRDARIGGSALGDLRARLAPLPLIVGRARVDLRGRGDPPVAGAVSISRHSIAIDDASVSLPTGNAFAPLPIGGFDLSGVSVKFQDGACRSADGRVTARMSGDIAGITLGQGMSGTARCDGDALLLPLASQAGTERALLRLWSGGRYTAELDVQPADPAMLPKLVASGFTPGPNGYTLSLQGNLR